MRSRKGLQNTDWMLFNTVKQRLGAALALQLVFFITSVQPCARRWPGGVSWNVQSPLRMMAAHRDVTTSYKRIRMVGFSDADIAYPLIATYLTNPDLAESVEEFIIKVDGTAYLSTLHSPGEDRLPFSVSESDHAAILKHVDSLGLATETTWIMKGALNWWRRTMLARPSQPWRDPRDYSLCNRGTTDDDEKKMYDDYASTTVALLLSLCPNISTLYLGEFRSGPLREYLLKSNYGLTPKPALQSLQHVEHYPYRLGLMYLMYDSIEPLHDLRYFHRLPQISSVSMEGVMENGVDLDVFPPRSSRGIRKLHYGHVDMSGDILSTIVRIPTALEEFSVSFGGLFSPSGGTSLVDVGLLGRSLDQHKETLRVLDIDLGEVVSHWTWYSEYPEEEDEEGFEDEWEFYENRKDEYFLMDKAISEGPLMPADVKKPEDHDGTIMVFRGYTALTHLSINIQAVVGQAEYVHERSRSILNKPPPFRLVDALPPNLEYLCLYGYVKGEVWEADELVQELMEKRYERLPRLVEVRGVDNVESTLDLQWDEDEGPSWTRPYTELDWVEA